MSGGTGKYNKYAAPKGPRTDLMNKLFGQNTPADKLPPSMVNVDEKAAMDATIAIATSDAGIGIAPSKGQQVGDLDLYPTGADLNFGNSPDISKVKWVQAGDPANPYAPDVTSPGAGKTEGADKASDPKLSPDELKVSIGNSAGFVPSANTKDPSSSGPAIATGGKLGTPGSPGKSGG